MNTILTATLICSISHINAWISPHRRLTLPLQLHPYAVSSSHQSGRQYQTSSRTSSLRTSTVHYSTTSSELENILSNLDDAKLPSLRIGNRIGSGSYGTVHECLLIKSKYDVQSCVAKRAWSYEEIEANVPKKVNDSDKIVARTGLASVKKDIDDVQLPDNEVKTRAERCKHYWEVERHCFDKLEKKKDGDDLLNRAVPTFLGTYHDDGSGRDSDAAVEGYGLIEGNKVGGWFGNGDEKADGHKWIVFDAVKSTVGEGAVTLLDAMEVRKKEDHYLVSTFHLTSLFTAFPGHI
jgi:hypothetical protein